MRAVTIAVAMLMASCSSSTADDAEKSVPERWHGEWNEDIATCGKHTNDSELVIRSDRLEYWESGGLVRGAFERGPFEIVIVLEMSGEGQTWLDAHRFTMSSSGSYIQTHGQDGSTFTRYRCPVTAS